jgi:hypothetical protein
MRAANSINKYKDKITNEDQIKDMVTYVFY